MLKHLQKHIGKNSMTIYIRCDKGYCIRLSFFSSTHWFALTAMQFILVEPSSHLIISKTSSKDITIQYCKDFVILLCSGKEKKKSFPKRILSNFYLQEIQRQLFYWSSLEKLAQALYIKTTCNDNCGQLLLTFVYGVTSPNVSETQLITDTHRIKPLLVLASTLDFNLCKPKPFYYYNDSSDCSEQLQVFFRREESREILSLEFQIVLLTWFDLQRFVTPWFWLSAYKAQWLKSIRVTKARKQADIFASRVALGKLFTRFQ